MQLTTSNGQVFVHQALSKAAVAMSMIVTEVGTLSRGVAQGVLVQAASTW